MEQLWAKAKEQHSGKYSGEGLKSALWQGKYSGEGLKSALW